MTAVQHHGFEFEDLVIQKITNLSKNNYQQLIPNKANCSFDIVQDDKYSNFNFSIKASKSLNIACGDCLRFYNHCKHDEFYMVVGLWRQVSDKKVYDKIYKVKFQPINFEKIWGTIDINELINFVNYVKNIPPGKAAQQEHKTHWKKIRNQLEENKNALVRINAKIDSGYQRRVQCSIQINKLIDMSFPVEVYSTEYLGLPLPYEQNSKARNS